MLLYNMSNLYNNEIDLYGVSIATDGVDVDYVDPTEGPKIIPDITNHPNGFLQVNPTATNIEWTSFTGGTGIPISRVLLGDGTALAPSLSFQNEANNDSGIYRDAENSVSISAGGLQRLQVTNSNVTVGTVTNNADLIVRGNIATNRYFAGDNLQGTPSYSFTNTDGTDTGMYYSFDSIDRLRFSAGGSFIMEMNSGQSFLNNRLLANSSTGNNTTPAVIFHNDSSTTGYSGQRTNPSTDPRLWAVVNGVQSTELTPTQFNVGLTNANNRNMKTLNQNGASNFNTFTPSYSSFIVPQTAIGTIGQSLSGVDFDGTNYVVSVAGTTGVNRLWVSQNLTTWTAITDTQIASGNSNVQFGNGIWCYISRTSGQRQLWTSTAPATTWTQIGSVAPWTTSRQINRLKFINGQFIALCNTSLIRFSSDGLNWTEYSINGTNYNLNDITYSPELQRYVIVSVSPVFLYFSGNTITNTSAFTAVTSGVEQANCCTYSPKLGMFLVHGNTNNQRYYISKDGINWTFYTNPTTVTNTNTTIWINDFGGFFLDMQFNTSNLAISRDGLSFQLIPNNLTMNSVNCVYNSTGKVLLIVGSSGSWGTFRNLLTDFNNYIDTDAIYNTFNSNTRFSDVIEYQNQVITPVSGDNHYTISTFTRPEVVFDTNAVNANIYLQGSSFNGRVGCKFKFIKSNTGHNVRIHGYETTTLISPTGNVSSFNAQSSPQTYSIIPAGYFGSFELTRISDSGNGVWIIDNVDVYDSAGTIREIGNLSVAGNLRTDGKLSVQNSGSMSAASPALYFSNDTDTGFYSSTANTLDITSAGINKVTIGNDFTIGNVSNSANLDLWGRETIRQIRVDTMTAKTADFTTSVTESSAITVDASTAVLTMTLSDTMPTGTILYIHKIDSANALRITNASGQLFNGLNRTNFVWKTNRGMGILRKFNSTNWQGIFVEE